MLLLLLSCCSRVWLCVTPYMAAHQALLSLGFSRQEHWSGWPFLLQCMKVKSESEVTQSYSTLRDPMDCSLPGFSDHGIFQARVLEWGAIAFSGIIYDSETILKVPWRRDSICIFSPIYFSSSTQRNSVNISGRPNQHLPYGLGWMPKFRTLEAQSDFWAPVGKLLKV